MPFAPGSPKPANSGRKKGVPAKLKPEVRPLPPRNLTIAERLKAMGVDPFTILADIASGDIDCGVCRGKGKTRYQAGSDRQFERKCQSCYGSCKERISPSERARAAAELAQYLEPKRKAIELSGSGGGPVLTKIEVVMVAAVDGKRVGIQTVDK